jgi:RNA polymerase sigma-70 factor (ECF subfamily)
LRIFRSRKSYEPTAKFVTWLTVIVRNVASNANRDHARRLEAPLGRGDEVNRLASLTGDGLGPSPAEQLEQAELRKAVRSAVRQLCARQRHAVVLQRFEHMKYDQIAASMGTSSKAVKSLLARARDRLRDELTPYVSDTDG